MPPTRRKGVGRGNQVFVHETFRGDPRRIISDLLPAIFYNSPNIRTRNTPAGKTRAAGHQQADEEIVRQMAGGNAISKGGDSKIHTTSVQVGGVVTLETNIRMYNK